MSKFPAKTVEMLIRMISEDGYRVRTFHSSDEANDYLENREAYILFMVEVFRELWDEGT